MCVAGSGVGFLAFLNSVCGPYIKYSCIKVPMQISFGGVFHSPEIEEHTGCVLGKCLQSFCSVSAEQHWFLVIMVSQTNNGGS